VTDKVAEVSPKMDEILTDIVDNQTGEIYRENMLRAAAYVWSACNKWKIVSEQIDQIEEMYDEPAHMIRWLYVEQTPDSVWT
jgi:hypothetical protein